MRNFINKKNIFWDFDGVIMDSMPVRNQGFKLVLKEFPEDQVELLMKYHLRNGGLSRYVKFRYFFEEIRGEVVSEEYINDWAIKFSNIMRKQLVNSGLLIEDTVKFIKENYKKLNMHIVSGSDQEELRFLCKELMLDIYFKSIHGSPTPKDELVRNLLNDNDYQHPDCVLIGDSINDYDAASRNNIDFNGYNNADLKVLNAKYIENFR